MTALIDALERAGEGKCPHCEGGIQYHPECCGHPLIQGDERNPMEVCCGAPDAIPTVCPECTGTGRARQQ